MLGLIEKHRLTRQLNLVSDVVGEDQFLAKGEEVSYGPVRTTDMVNYFR